MAHSQELEAASRSSKTYLAEWERWRQTCVRSTSVLHLGSRRHMTELPGAHSRERLRHRQAPNDDDDKQVPLGIGYRRKGSQKHKWWGYQMVDTFSRFDTIPAVTGSQPPSHVAVAYTSLCYASRYSEFSDVSDRRHGDPSDPLIRIIIRS